MSIDSALTGDSGVAFVRYRAQRRLRWLVRELPTHDYGVDAEAERIDGNVPSGQLIGLQVKTGSSHFAEPTEAGWIYRPTQRHVTYWTNHSLPIFILFVNLDDESIFWQYVGADTLKSVGSTTWKMLIPRNNQLDSAGSAWLEAAESNDREALTSFDANTRRLPPSAARGLIALHEDLPVLSSRLAKSLATQDAQTIAARLVHDTPSWLSTAPYRAWQVISSYCSDHEFRDLAIDALLRASEFQENPVRAENLANAALLASSSSSHHAPIDFLNRAKVTDESSYVVAVAGAILSAEGFPLPDLGPADPESPPHIQAAMYAYMRERSARDGNFTEALQHGERARQLSPDNTTYTLVNADLYTRRSASDQAGVDDLGAAVNLGEAVIAARQLWHGPLLEPYTTVIRAHLLQHNNSAVGMWVTPAPEGRLDNSLTDAPSILEYRFKHHLLSGSVTAAQEVAAGISDPLLRAKMDADLLSRDGTREEQVQAWRQVVSLAQATADHPRLASAGLRLAMLGHLDETILQAIQATKAIDDLQLDVIRTIAELNAGRAGSERVLRRLADIDATAAEALIEYYASNSQLAKAETAAERGAQRFRNPMFLVRLIDLVRQYGQPNEAMSTARRILMDSRVRGAARMSALSVVVSDADKREDWASAEAWCNQALEVASAADRASWAWRLVITQLNQRATDRAFESFLRYRPEVRDAPEAELWLRVHQGRIWDAETIIQALDVEAVASEEARLSGPILLQAVFQSSNLESDEEDGDAAPPYRARLQAQLQLHIQRHGAAGGITQLQGTPEELLGRISGMAQLRANALNDVHRQVAHGQVPFGLLASAAGRPYSTSLTLGAAPLVAGTVDEAAFDKEVEAARSAMDGRIIVGLEALHVASVLDASDEILGLFDELIITRSARDDLSAGLADARQSPASESLVWREETEELVRVPHDPAVNAAALLLLQKMDVIASRWTLDQPESALFPELRQAGINAWSAAVKLAEERDLPLWTDDRVVRQLCDDLSISNFGTLALLEAAEGTIRNLVVEDVISALATRSIVDLPVTAAFWRDLAEREKFAPRTAALMITRPSFWAWVPGVEQDVRYVMTKAEQAQPGSARYWRRSAMMGIGRSQNEADVPIILIKFALFGLDSRVARSLAEAVVEGIEDARWVAQHLNAADPYIHFDLFLEEMLEPRLTVEARQELRVQVEDLLTQGE